MSVSDILDKTEALMKPTLEFERNVGFRGRLYDFYFKKHKTLMDFTGQDIIDRGHKVLMEGEIPAIKAGFRVILISFDVFGATDASMMLSYIDTALTDTTYPLIILSAAKKRLASIGLSP